MVSDEELVERLREFLRSSDLSTTTTGAVRRQLEADFGVDLSSKKAFIREQVDLFLSTELNDNKEEAKEEQDDEPNEEQEEDDEEEEDEDEEDEGTTNGGGSKKRKSSKANKEEKRRGGGFTKLCSLSPELQNFLGESELARTEVVKKLWAYIREKELQDPKNRRKIICDEKLKRIFNVNTIDMFQMNKALTKHIWPLEDGVGHASSGSSKAKEKPQKKDKNSEEKSGKKQKTGGSGSGLLAPLPLSDDLVKFFGTGETTLSRSDVVKRMWAYIKENDLQDPSDRRNVICDDKLKELLKVDTFNGFTVSKLLAPHFIKE